MGTDPKKWQPVNIPSLTSHWKSQGYGVTNSHLVSMSACTQKKVHRNVSTSRCGSKCRRNKCTSENSGCTTQIWKSQHDIASKKQLLKPFVLSQNDKIGYASPRYKKTRGKIKQKDSCLAVLSPDDEGKLQWLGTPHGSVSHGQPSKHQPHPQRLVVRLKVFVSRFLGSQLLRSNHP